MRFVLLMLALLPFCAAAQPVNPNDTKLELPGGYRPEFDEDKPWDEQKAVLPSYPRPENLVKFDAGPSSSFEFLVDIASVSVAKDRVVRYTLVARSPSGAMNVSYEGLRCKTRERRLYGFGRPDNTWVEARNSDWIDIGSARTVLPQSVLADDYFCMGRSSVRTTAEAVAMLKRGGNPAARTAPTEMTTPPR